MKIEKPYEFRKRRHTVHLPDRRNPERVPFADEVEVDSSWTILLPKKAEIVIQHVAADLQDYFFTSMNVPLRLAYEGDVNQKCILLKPENNSDGFSVKVSPNQICVSAQSSRMLFPGVVYLEDCMNLAEAPVLPMGVKNVKNRIRMRAVHSGCGIDDFPDAELNATVHAGFNTIVLFIRDLDKNAFGYMNINELADRAEIFGLDLLFYNLIPSFKHPSDPDAESFFDSIYGELFRRHPKAVGIMLCGESLEFPSRDNHSTGKRWRDSFVNGIPDTRPSPGWYPCEDYPAYLARIERAVHKVNPEASIYFNTTNWGYQPAVLRRKFLKKFPPGLKLTVTYEIFKKRDMEGWACPMMDYTILTPDPGEYFLTEAKAAHSNGIQMFLVTNTAGMTWDFGTVPYVPTPQLWIERFLHLEKARRKFGITEWYECHHYGWWNCVVTDLAKWSCQEPGTFEPDTLLRKIAIRDYGRACADNILEIWRTWSNAMRCYVASNEDQYGPCRVGPAYPFIFHPDITRTMAGKEISFPASSHAHFGGLIIKTFYRPFGNLNQSAGHLRYPAEIRSLQKMLSAWNHGLFLLEKTRPSVPDRNRPEFDRLEALGIFIRNTVVTMIHIKQWWLLNIALQAASDRKTSLKVLTRIKILAYKEIKNTRDTFRAVDCDSRLGWEPSMEYVADRWHLEWKIRQVESALREIADFRKTIQLHS